MSELEDVKRQLLELDVKAKKNDLKFAELDLPFQNQYKEMDILSQQSEINRRGIEACMSILKTDAHRNGFQPVEDENHKLANKRLGQFLTALKAA
jgi:hypothetical protein